MTSIDVDAIIYSPKNVTARYKKYLIDLANIQAKIRDIAEDLEQISEHYGDNGDTAEDAKEVLVHLGNLLADAIVYASEYEEKIEKLKPKKAESK